jgi:glycine cleavage system H protein
MGGKKAMSDYLETTVDKFTFRVHAGYLYSEAGVWIAYDPESATARIGLTDYRQQSSGDMAFVALPEVGTAVHAGEEIARLETVKVDLEVPAPCDGVVTAVNAALKDQPELINQEPYAGGWLAELRPAAWPAADLMNPEAYLAVMQAQAEAGANE